MVRHLPAADHSRELLEAQERLLALRKEFAQKKTEAVQQAVELKHGRSTSPTNHHPQQNLADLIKELPPHLGWESSAVTDLVR